LSLASLIGLHKEKKKALIDINACKKTGNLFPHTIISGIGGTGKTALALAIGQELNYHTELVEAGAIKTRKNVLNKLQHAHSQALSKNKKLLFFIDEVHQLKPNQQEFFYYPLDKDDPRFTTDGETIHFNKFTIIAATTRLDMLDQHSFVNRFVNKWSISNYTTDDIILIINSFFQKNHIKANYLLISSLAERCLGNPRQAIRLSNRCKSILDSENRHTLNKKDIDLTFEIEEIDVAGLDLLEVKYLKILYESGLQNPRGLSSIAGRLGEKEEIVETTIEPILLNLNFIDRVSKGRIITKKGLDHIVKNHL
jgi:Holliday junction DNA helicase RuvB